MTAQDVWYTADHEWLRLESDGTVVVGITDFAQNAMGDVVYVQLPDAGEAAQAGSTLAEVESIKSVAEVYAPISGSVVAVNTDVDASPELVNSDPYGRGWLVRIAVEGELETSGFMDDAAYAAHTEGL